MEQTNPSSTHTPSSPQLSVKQEINETRPKKNSFSLLFLIIIMSLFIGIGLIFILRNIISKNQTSQPIKNNISVFTKTMFSPDEKILFFKTLGREASNSAFLISEMWMMNPDGTQQEKISVPQKNPAPLTVMTTGWIFYTSGEQVNNNIIYAYNYKTKQTKTIMEVNQPGTITSVDEFSISPDGNKLVYHVEDLYEGSNGQDIQKDFYPTHKMGTYVYNVLTDKKVYLGDLAEYTTWSADSKYLYTNQAADYHEYTYSGGLYKFDTDTGLATSIDHTMPSSDAFYFEYPVNSNELIAIDMIKSVYGGAGGGDDIKVIKDGNAKIVEQNNTSCTLADCLVLSPNGDYAEYSSDQVMVLDLKNQSVKPVMSYPKGWYVVHPTWISNTQFVIGKYDPTNEDVTADIYTVDVLSGKVSQLTTTHNTRLW